MRRILIALALAMASTEAATQTTEGAEERTEQRTLTERVSEWVQRTIGWAPTGQVRELQAELEQLTTALDQREDAVRRNEEAVRQQAARNRRRGAELRNQAAALEQQEEEVEEGLLQADQTMKESRAIALTAAILAAAAGGWSLWRLQPSTVARLNQRRRTAEQGLRAMRAEWDEAHAKLRKKASALTAAKRKNNVLRNALDGAEARCRDAMAAAEETVETSGTQMGEVPRTGDPSRTPSDWPIGRILMHDRRDETGVNVAPDIGSWPHSSSPNRCNGQPPGRRWGGRHDAVHPGMQFAAALAERRTERGSQKGTVLRHLPHRARWVVSLDQVALAVGSMAGQLAVTARCVDMVQSQYFSRYNRPLGEGNTKPCKR